MRTITKSTIAAALMAAFSFAPLAHAGLFDDDEARRAVLDLRKQIEALNTRIDSKADNNGLLDLASQNEHLRQEVARLRGQVEVLTNELANTQQRQKDFYVDLDNRLRKIEPQKMTVDGKEASVEPGEQRSYEAGLAQFKAADYKGASATFSDFVRRYPQSGFAASAQYFLGITYYALRDYRNAIAAQQAVIRNYPDSPKAPEALLNIATSYTELKDKASAKRTLETLIAQYPETQAAQTARDRLPTLR